MNIPIEISFPIFFKKKIHENLYPMKNTKISYCKPHEINKEHKQ